MLALVLTMLVALAVLVTAGLVFVSLSDRIDAFEADLRWLRKHHFELEDQYAALSKRLPAPTVIVPGRAGFVEPDEPPTEPVTRVSDLVKLGNS